MEESRAFWSLLSDLEVEEAARASRSRGTSWQRISEPEDCYQEVLTALHPAAEELLEQYTEISDYEMVPHALQCVSNLDFVLLRHHLTAIKRDRAWSISPSEFVGQFAFTVPNIQNHPKYREVLARLNRGHTLLDLGCGFGQDIRKLIVDGVNPGTIVGVDIEEGLIACGYEYFQDGDTLSTPFLVGDVLDPDSEVAIAAEGTFNLIWASSFYQFWGWEEQLRASIQTARLLKQRRGSMVFGFQLGSSPATEVQRTLSNGRTRHTTEFRHDGDSFRRLWEQVKEALGIDFDVRIVSVAPPWVSQLPTGASTVELMTFSVTIIE
jgi:SAM-dependent methyltransferase